jgi:PAS domain S-box-containing protein
MGNPKEEQERLAEIRTRDPREEQREPVGAGPDKGLPAAERAAGEAVPVRAPEEGLRFSDDRYRNIVETANDAIVVVQDGLAKFANARARELFGYQEQEYATIPVFDLIHREDRDRVRDYYARRLAGEILPPRNAYRVVGQDGSVRWIENSSVRIAWDGRPATLNFINDITARKRTEEALKESEKRFRLLAENATDVIWTMDFNGKCGYVSPSITAVAGYAPEEFLNLSLEDYVVEPYPASLRRELDEELQKPPEERQRIKMMEIQHYRKDGSIIDVEITMGWLFDEQGNAVGIQGSTRDVTARRRMQKALQESERILATLMRNLPGMVYRCANEPGWPMLFVSEGSAALTGYAPEELSSGRRVAYGDLIHPEDRGRVWETVQRGLQQGYPFDMAYRILTGSGQEKWVLEQGRGVYGDSGELLFLEGFITDISDRKRMELQLLQAQKMEAIGTLAGGIAHDFNNLLMGIAGYASLVKLDLEPDHRHFGMVCKIEEQVGRGADLTRQLLGFARGGRYEVKPVQLNDLISKTAEIFQRTHREISLCWTLQNDLWTLEVDVGQIEQVLLNLLLNACQAMPGGGEITLETENVSLADEATALSVKPGQYVRFSLSDTGVGMDEKTQARIFEPFFTTRGMGQGTGLGLAVVYGIVKGHQGAIRVSSEPGRGTTFSIFLPASLKEVTPQAPTFEEVVKGREGILLVDDEKDVSEVARELLEVLGYRVFPVGSGQEALAVYMEKRSRIDLVILDMVMPGISGEETFVRLRQMNPDVKVILSSGYSIDSRARNIMEQGCNGFLQKPYTLKGLSKILRATLAGAAETANV